MSNTCATLTAAEVSVLFNSSPFSPFPTKILTMKLLQPPVLLARLAMGIRYLQ